MEDLREEFPPQPNCKNMNTRIIHKNTLLLSGVNYTFKTLKFEKLIRFTFKL